MTATPARPTHALLLPRALLILCIAALPPTGGNATAAHIARSQHTLMTGAAPPSPPPLPLIPAPVQVQRGHGQISIDTRTPISIPPR